MKKILALLLTLILVIGTFAACDSVEKETDAPTIFKKSSE